MSNVINAVWFGNELGEIHSACLRSFVRHGYDVVLHSFGYPTDAPKGVRIFDANKLMSQSELTVFQKYKRLAFAADIYRYRIQREGLGAYVDCDVYCIRRFPEDDYIFGWESEYAICNAVMKLPHDSVLLTKMLNASEDPYFIPPWLKDNRRKRLLFRKYIGLPKHVVHQRWGIIGPELLTHYVKKLDLTAHASDIDAFYSLHYEQTALLFSKGLRVEDIVSSRSFALHLFSSRLRSRTIEGDTPLAQIIKQ